VARRRRKSPAELAKFGNTIGLSARQTGYLHFLKFKIIGELSGTDEPAISGLEGKRVAQVAVRGEKKGQPELPLFFSSPGMSRIALSKVSCGYR
jgi:hypothetical protein